MLHARVSYLQVMRTSPYGVHADYIFGGLIAKRNRLRGSPDLA